MTDACTCIWNVYLLSIKEGGWFKAIPSIMLFIDLNANDTDVHNEKKDTLHRFWNRILNSFSIDVNGVLFAVFSIKYLLLSIQKTTVKIRPGL